MIQQVIFVFHSNIYLDNTLPYWTWLSRFRMYLLQVCIKSCNSDNPGNSTNTVWVNMITSVFYSPRWAKFTSSNGSLQTDLYICRLSEAAKPIQLNIIYAPYSPLESRKSENLTRYQQNPQRRSLILHRDAKMQGWPKYFVQTSYFLSFSLPLSIPGGGLYLHHGYWWRSWVR